MVILIQSLSQVTACIPISAADLVVEAYKEAVQYVHVVLHDCFDMQGFTKKIMPCAHLVATGVIYKTVWEQ
jgi:hypothetical protein